MNCAVHPLFGGYLYCQWDKSYTYLDREVSPSLSLVYLWGAGLARGKGEPGYEATPPAPWAIWLQ